MRAKILMMLTLSILLLAAFASAQGTMTVNAKIPFAFSVEAKVLPAGQYSFAEGPNAAAVTVGRRPLWP
jgi:hypothetical protein